VCYYLKALLGDGRTDVVFVGYQAAGTPGRELQAGKKRVTIDGRSLSVKAQVHSLSGYSAHADQAELLRFAGGIRRAPERVVLVHGESGARRALRRKLEQHLGHTL
jgi:metallo-beta-lactamase family protein